MICHDSEESCNLKAYGYEKGTSLQKPTYKPYIC